MMSGTSQIINLQGQRFTNLTVLSISDIRKSRSACWLCACICGKQIIVSRKCLRTGETKSCGCYAIKHGQSQRKGSKPSKTYAAWINMRNRCFNSKNTEYRHYGARGISVCERWNKFENFLSDMGEGLKGLSIDRIDVNGNYEPGNCRWATLSQQARNKRTNNFVTHNGVTRLLVEWVEELGVSCSSIRYRIKTGKPIDYSPSAKNIQKVGTI